MDFPVPGIVLTVPNTASIINKREDTPMSTSHEHAHGDSKKAYYRVYGALLALTALTVGAAQIHFPHSMGQLGVLINLAIGLIIATVKVSLVLYIFMHLKFDNKFLRAFVLVPVFLFFVMVFALTNLETFHHPF